MTIKENKSYWNKNIRYVSILSAIWLFVSFGCGIILAPWLNQFTIGGFKLGFWFAQQGSILVFVVLIFIYVLLMNKMDDAMETNEDPGA